MTLLLIVFRWNQVLNQYLTNGSRASFLSVTALERRAVWPFLCCCSMVYHWGLSAPKPTRAPLTFLWHFTVWMWRLSVWHKLSHLRSPTGSGRHLGLRRPQPGNTEREVVYMQDVGSFLLKWYMLICCWLLLTGTGREQQWALGCFFFFLCFVFS